MNTNEIMEAYKNGEKTLEETNAALKAAGANFHLDPLKEKVTYANKEEAEAHGAVLPADPNAEKKYLLPDTPDMSRKPELAGMTVVQRTKSGEYNVTYDEIGYAQKALKR